MLPLGQMENQAPETPMQETPQAPCECGKALSLPLIALIVVTALVAGSVGGYVFGKTQNRQNESSNPEENQTQQQTEPAGIPLRVVNNPFP